MLAPGARVAAPPGGQAAARRCIGAQHRGRAGGPRLTWLAWPKQWPSTVPGVPRSSLTRQAHRHTVPRIASLVAACQCTTTWCAPRLSKDLVLPCTSVLCSKVDLGLPADQRVEQCLASYDTSGAGLPFWHSWTNRTWLVHREETQKLKDAAVRRGAATSRPSYRSNVRQAVGCTSLKALDPPQCAQQQSVPLEPSSPQAAHTSGLKISRGEVAPPASRVSAHVPPRPGSHSGARRDRRERRSQLPAPNRGPTAARQRQGASKNM